MKFKVRAARKSQAVPVVLTKSNLSEQQPQVLVTVIEDGRGVVATERRGGDQDYDERDLPSYEVDTPSMDEDGLETEAVICPGGQKFTRVIMDGNRRNKSSKLSQKQSLFSRNNSKNSQGKLESKEFLGSESSLTSTHNNANVVQDDEECVDIEEAALKRELEESLEHDPQGGISLRKLLTISSMLMKEDEKLETKVCKIKKPVDDEASVECISTGHRSNESFSVSEEASIVDEELFCPVTKSKQTGRSKLLRKLSVPSMTKKTSFRGLFGKAKASEADSVSGFSEVTVTVHSESPEADVAQSISNDDFQKNNLAGSMEPTSDPKDEGQMTSATEYMHALGGAFCMMNGVVSNDQMKEQATIVTEQMAPGQEDKLETTSETIPKTKRTVTVKRNDITKTVKQTKCESTESVSSGWFPFSFASSMSNKSIKEPADRHEQQIGEETDNVQTGADKPMEKKAEEDTDTGWDLAEAMAIAMDFMVAPVIDMAVGKAEPSANYGGNRMNKPPELIEKETDHTIDKFKLNSSRVEQKKKVMARLVELSKFRPAHLPKKVLLKSEAARKLKSDTHSRDSLPGTLLPLTDPRLNDDDDDDTISRSSFEEDSSLASTISHSSASNLNNHSRSMALVAEENGNPDWSPVKHWSSLRSWMGNQPSTSDIVQNRRRSPVLATRSDDDGSASSTSFPTIEPTRGLGSERPGSLLVGPCSLNMSGAGSDSYCSESHSAATTTPQPSSHEVATTLPPPEDSYVISSRSSLSSASSCQAGSRPSSLALRAADSMEWNVPKSTNQYLSDANDVTTQKEYRKKESTRVFSFLHTVSSTLSSIGLGMSMDEDDITDDTSELPILKENEETNGSDRTLKKDEQTNGSVPALEEDEATAGSVSVGVEDEITMDSFPVISEADLKVLRKHAQILGIDVQVLIDAQENGAETQL